MKKKPKPRVFSAAALARAAGVSKRSLSRWFAAGILAQPRRGPGVTYGEDQVLRARAARALRGAEGLGLDDLRERLDGASAAQIEAWATGKAYEAPPPEPPALPRASHAHVELAPGLTLVLREGCDPAVRRMAQEICQRYGPGR